MNIEDSKESDLSLLVRSNRKSWEVLKGRLGHRIPNRVDNVIYLLLTAVQLPGKVFSPFEVGRDTCCLLC
jgi:hypothetical protein